MIKSLEYFKTFYESHAKFVRSVLFRLVGNDLLDDAVQECFFKAWKNRSSFKGESSEKTWLYRIATNTAIDMLRKKKVNIEFEDSISSDVKSEESLKYDIQKKSSLTFQ